MEFLEIESPERVIIKYRLADPGIRAAAFLLDNLIIGTCFFFFILSGCMLSFSESEFSAWMVSFVYLMFFVMSWFYFLFFETLLRGQTPGKRLLGIRVIPEDAGHLEFPALVYRNFIRCIDNFPVLGLLGGVVSLIDKKNRRLGDLAAGTLVITEDNSALSLPDVSIKLEEKAVATANAKRQALSEKQLFIIRSFLAQRGSLDKARREALAKVLCSEICKALDAEIPADKFEEYVEAVYFDQTSSLTK